MKHSPEVITVRNVNHALPIAAMLFNNEANYRRIAPRDPAKVTREMRTPVVTVYARPLERVLYSPQRDANPFFHCLEALWILAGRGDVGWLARVLPNIKDYSDNGINFHGAYGARMRATASHEDGQIDQLASVIKQLKKDPDSRRAVIALYQPDLDAGYSGKDMPCNTTLLIKVRDGFVNLSVFNRSNDAIWGAYGANVVQFSTILEYVANMLDLPVGTMYTWSDSFHVYENEPSWQRCKDLPMAISDPYDYPAQNYADFGAAANTFDKPVKPYRLVENPDMFDTELNHFMNISSMTMKENVPMLDRVNTKYYHNSYLDQVARPMLNALICHKRGEAHNARIWALQCAATDWQLAALLWLERRASVITEAR